jgi:hypothetical protein
MMNSGMTIAVLGILLHCQQAQTASGQQALTANQQDICAEHERFRQPTAHAVIIMS